DPRGAASKAPSPATHGAPGLSSQAVRPSCRPATCPLSLDRRIACQSYNSSACSRFEPNYPDPWFLGGQECHGTLQHSASSSFSLDSRSGQQQRAPTTPKTSLPTENTSTP